MIWGGAVTPGPSVEPLLGVNTKKGACKEITAYRSVLPFPHSSPVWAQGRCKISPSRFLAECCKKQLNLGSFILLYFRLSTFSDLLSLFICIFLHCFVCQYQSSDWL